jgi:hypothetical protein
MLLVTALAIQVRHRERRAVGMTLYTLLALVSFVTKRDAPDEGILHNREREGALDCIGAIQTLGLRVASDALGRDRGGVVAASTVLYGPDQ